MVKFILTLFFLMCLSALQAQIQFFKIFSDIGFEKGEGITQLSDSSYLITGSSTSFGDGPPQAFLMKIDSLGNRIWAKHYGGSEINEGKRVFAIENDGYYIGGNTNSNPNADFNFYFVKTDESGNPIFEKQFGTPAWDFVHDGIMLSDSSVILTGETYNTTEGLEDAYTLKVDKNGDTLWTRQSLKIGSDRINAIEQVGDSAFVLAGTTYNSDSLAKKAFIGLYKNDNTVVWEKEYGSIGDFEIQDVELWNNVLHCVGNRVFIPDSLKDVYVVRVNLLGDTLSSYSYLGSSDKSMNNLVKYGNSNKFYIDETYIDQYSLGIGEDFFLARYTDYFAFDYSLVTFNAIGKDEVGELLATNDGGAIAVGTNRSFGTQNANVFVLKIGANDSYPLTTGIPILNSLVEIEKLKQEKTSFSIFPNPTRDKFNFTSGFSKGEILVYNAQGLLSKSFTLVSNSDELDISDLDNGIYHLVYESETGLRTIAGKISKF